MSLRSQKVTLTIINCIPLCSHALIGIVAYWLWDTNI